MKLSISDSLKVGKQELLLGCKTVAKAGYIGSCSDCVDPVPTSGSEVDGLTAADLVVPLSDNSCMPLIDFILQRNISLHNINVTTDCPNTVITWLGDPNTKISIDGSNYITPNGSNKHTISLTNGNHVIKLLAPTDIRPATITHNVLCTGCTETTIHTNVNLVIKQGD